MTGSTTPPGFRGRWLEGPRARAAYAEGAGIYRIVPQAVAQPLDRADLAALAAWATKGGRPLVPRGAGSGMGGGNVGEGIVVDLTAMSPQRLELDPARRLAVTGAAVTLEQLNRAALPHGLRLPPAPSSGRFATLGGMVATNAAGARSLRYGSVRPWVEALDLVTAEGELATVRRDGPAPAVAAFRRWSREVAPAVAEAELAIRARFPAVRKNSSGYALDAYLAGGSPVDLLIGSEGTLAFFTEITWRLAPLPAARASLRLDLPDLALVAEVVTALLPLGPSAMELLDRTFLEVVRDGGALADDPPAETEAVLLVEFEHDREAAARGVVGDAVRAVADLPLNVTTALTDEAAQRLWALRHAASPILASLPERSRSLQVVEDGCVPVGRLGEYIRVLRDAGARHGLPLVIFGHAGDGNLHVNLLPDVTRTDWVAAVAALYRDVSAAVIGLGGTPSGEHGDGRLRAGLLEQLYGGDIVELFGRVKQAFDPAGILNPGVILPDGRPPISRLKAGSAAAALPADIAAGLRDIERRGGYATPRLTLAGEESRP